MADEEGSPGRPGLLIFCAISLKPMPDIVENNSAASDQSVSSSDQAMQAVDEILEMLEENTAAAKEVSTGTEECAPEGHPCHACGA